MTSTSLHILSLSLHPSTPVQVWVIGNVEEVAVVRGTVDKNRATGTNSGSYLLNLEKDQRPVKGVHIDDGKAVFLLRWYQETKANGEVIKDQYQQKECKQFYLPLDNGGYPFEWVSNLQVITAVHLKSHITKNRTFTLPGADKKTIVEAFKKMVGK